MAMERHESLKLWQKSYDLAKELMIVTEKFPRPQQRDGGLANEIRRMALNVLRTVMIANNRQNVAINQDLDQEIEYLQTLVRMARELEYVSLGRYELLAKRTVELGKMNAGWMKRIG
jgi:four helix bundle protein